MAQNGWPLPVEITKRIIELAYWSNRSADFVVYAGVSREWRDLVECITFRYLRLDQTRLADVSRIVCRRRQACVRAVDIVVKLEPYGRKLYRAVETAEENARNSVIFSDTLRLLFDVFSRWAPAGGGSGLDGDGDGDGEGVGIQLSITAFSPSDPGRYGEGPMGRELWYRPGIGSDRYIQSVLQLLPAATELPVVRCVSRISSGGSWPPMERHISASAWTLIINSLPNANKIDIRLWDNAKKNLELRKQLRDETGHALTRMHCPNADVTLSCLYVTPKDHSSIPRTLIDARESEAAFARGLRKWTRQLKQLRLSKVVIAPEVFYAASPDDEEAASGWPNLEWLEVSFAAVTPHGTWLLERDPEDPPCDRPLPVNRKLLVEVPAPEDMCEYAFRTLPVAMEMDRIHRSVARAARRMPALQYLYLGTSDQATQWGERHHGFLFRYDAARGVATAHWGSLPAYTPAEDVVQLWRELVAEVRGCQLEVLIDENDVRRSVQQQ
ncbi:hypothetical protein MKX08_009180 [Trichoderma sp. CBMAI-0020]|nr:hypothetical protein MKX08_009180 [Trichoderma sp. CBMAI-0020]